jgi:hypothetical protein
MKQTSKSIGLLIVIIMAALFFSIVCAIVLQIFHATKTSSDRSSDETMALNCAQSIGAIYLSDEEFYGAIETYYGEPLGVDNHMFFDEDMKLTDKENAVFAVYLDVRIKTETEVGELQELVITVSKEDEKLSELTMQKYVGKAVGA